MSERKAAALVGISPRTLNNWAPGKPAEKPQLYKLVMDNYRKQVKK